MSLIDVVYRNMSGNSDEKVSAHVKQWRMDKCNSCPKKLLTGNCLVCGCFVKAKTDYTAESCPLGKW